MKIESCPKCGCTSLGERWSKGRMLEQYCHGEDWENCYWVGEPFEPTRRRITNTTRLRIDNFSGWHYIVYDKYGRVHTDSATYDSKAKAMKDMVDDITPRNGYVDPAAPFTAVLVFVPSGITIKGQMFKVKKGKLWEKPA